MESRFTSGTSRALKGQLASGKRNQKSVDCAEAVDHGGKRQCGLIDGSGKTIAPCVWNKETNICAKPKQGVKTRAPPDYRDIKREFEEDEPSARQVKVAEVKKQLRAQAGIVGKTKESKAYKAAEASALEEQQQLLQSMKGLKTSDLEEKIEAIADAVEACKTEEVALTDAFTRLAAATLQEQMKKAGLDDATFEKLEELRICRLTVAEIKERAKRQLIAYKAASRANESYADKEFFGFGGKRMRRHYV